MIFCGEGPPGATMPSHRGSVSIASLGGRGERGRAERGAQEAARAAPTSGGRGPSAVGRAERNGARERRGERPLGVYFYLLALR